MSDMEACGSEEKSGFLPDYEDVNQFMQQTLKSVLLATKCSNEMPAPGDDFDYYSSFQGFQDVMNIEGNRLLNVIQSILRHQNVKVNLGTTGGAADMEDKLDLLMDANDQILERAGNWLDEASGIKKTDSSLVVATATPKQGIASWNKKSPSASGSTTPSFRLLSARNIQRPQLKFKDKMDNSRNPFIPVIKHKCNALKPLEESLRLAEGTTPEMSELSDFRHPHPYQYELDQLNFLPEQLCMVEAKQPGSLEDTPFTLVEKLEDLKNLVKTLKTQAEIAVDLEHHNYRTFQGITCLLQLSTRTHDYLVDTLELRSDLHLLNEVFTDCNIVKVFHGADSDIDWLQRDFGVYVVNMFDTGQAARVMNLSRFSLAHLLQIYCDVTADKQYQLADWRIRPLPVELKKYAREDTHYLLYIYDMLKNELLQRGNENKNLLLSVLQRSTQVCARVYKKPQYTEEGYIDLYKKNKKLFNSRQMMALQEMFSWRDETARMEDESYGYVLPNHMLLQICDILPRERQGVLACCNPIPPLVRQYLNEIHAIICKARDAPLHKVAMTTEKERQPTALQHPKYDVDGLLNCPHDLSHEDQSSSRTLETVLDSSLMSKKSSLFPTGESNTIIVIKSQPLLTVFDFPVVKRQTDIEKKVAEIKSSFVDPYVQYLPEAPSGVVKPAMTINVAKSKKEQPTWKLVPATTKRKERETSLSDTPAPAGPPAKRSRTDLHDGVNTHIRFDDAGDDDDDETAGKTEDDKKAIPQDIEIPLRFQMQSKKKKKKNRNRDTDIMESVQEHLKNIRKLQEVNDLALGQNLDDEKPPEQNDNKNKKKKKKTLEKKEDKKNKNELKTEVTVEIESLDKDTGGDGTSEEFKPYDYAEGAKMFSQANKGRKSDHFDPQAQMRKGKGPKVSRNKANSNRGKKSFTWKT